LLLLTKCYWGDQIKEDELGRACGRYGGEENFVTGFWWEKPVGKRPLGKRVCG
jgi:hypothetical protein